MEIKILGTGCPNCKKLEENVRLALDKMTGLKEKGIEVDIIKLTDIAEIMNYNLLSNPGLVIDEKVVSYGSVPEVDTIKELIKGEICEKIEKEGGKCECGGNC